MIPAPSNNNPPAYPFLKKLKKLIRVTSHKYGTQFSPVTEKTKDRDALIKEVMLSYGFYCKDYNTLVVLKEFLARLPGERRRAILKVARAIKNKGGAIDPSSIWGFRVFFRRIVRNNRICLNEASHIKTIVSTDGMDLRQLPNYVEHIENTCYEYIKKIFEAAEFPLDMNKIQAIFREVQNNRKYGTEYFYKE